jgi:hypothetical protein
MAKTFDRFVSEVYKLAEEVFQDAGRWHPAASLNFITKGDDNDEDGAGNSDGDGGRAWDGDGDESNLKRK